jgi:hypothetical protein
MKIIRRPLILQPFHFPLPLLFLRWQRRASSKKTRHSHSLVFIDAKTERGFDLADNSQRRIANLEDMLVETREAVLGRDGVGVEERVGEAVASSEDDFVEVFERAAVVEFDCSASVGRDAFYGWFGDDAWEVESFV